MFKTYRDKIQMKALGKNPSNYQTVRKETNIYEQKPISIADFNDFKEAEVEEQIEKQKAKRQELAENKKLLEKQKIVKKTKFERKSWGSGSLSSMESLKA